MGDEGALLYEAGSGAPRAHLAHVKEALWVLSNLLGGSPAHAAAVLVAPAPDAVLATLAGAVGPSFAESFRRLPLAVPHILNFHLLHSPWPVRIEAAMCIANLAKQVRRCVCVIADRGACAWRGRAHLVLSMQRARTALAAADAAAGGGSAVALHGPLLPAHPFLAAVLAFEGTVGAFLGLLQCKPRAPSRAPPPPRTHARTSLPRGPSCSRRRQRRAAGPGLR